MGAHFGEDGGTIRNVNHYRNIMMVLGSSADHGRPADVDILDAFIMGTASGHGLLERIEVHHQQIDRADAVGQHRGLMLGVGTHSQQAAMHGGVQGDPPSIISGKPVGRRRHP